MDICRMENISKHYDQGELVEPLKDITLTVAPGDFVAIEGPSGIGKSTLLYVMGTLLGYDGGTLEIMGNNISAMDDKQKTQLRAESIGFMFQDASLIQALTLRENLRFTQTLGGRAKPDEQRIDELLEQVGLSDRAGFFPHQLSGGQKRRAMAAQALIHKPSLLLVDEPTNDLNEEWAHKVLGLLSDAVEQGAAAVMVTHHSAYAQKASRAYRLEGGTLVQ